MTFFFLSQLPRIRNVFKTLSWCKKSLTTVYLLFQYCSLKGLRRIITLNQVAGNSSTTGKPSYFFWLELKMLRNLPSPQIPADVVELLRLLPKTYPSYSNPLCTFVFLPWATTLANTHTYLYSISKMFLLHSHPTDVCTATCKHDNSISELSAR